MNESTSSEKNRTMSLQDAGKDPWTAANWHTTQLCTCTPFIWRTKGQLKDQFNPLAYILASPVISTADQLRTTQTEQQQIPVEAGIPLRHIHPAFDLFHLYVTWRHAGRQGGTPEVLQLCVTAMDKETPQHVFHSSSYLTIFPCMYVHHC